MYNIDSTFFVGQISIPNVSDPNGLNIDTYIEKGCYLFLQSILGAKLFNELKENLDSERNLKADADQKWKDLFFGKQYGDKVFLGLIQEEVTYSQSVMADYVFTYWLKNSLSKITGIGNVALEGKNAKNVNSSPIYRAVWNSICESVGIDHVHNHGHKTVSYIHGVRYTDYSGSSNSGLVTIKEFLLDHSEDYPNPSLSAPTGERWEVINYLGL